MRTLFASNLILVGILATGVARAGSLDDLLGEYRVQGAGAFSATAGEALWRRSFPSSGETPRTCTSCHASDARQRGRHAVTGKTIEPMAPSVNPKRLSERREIEKWLKRNCTWTLGRECSPQEKGDLLSFLRNQ